MMMKIRAATPTVLLVTVMKGWLANSKRPQPEEVTYNFTVPENDAGGRAAIGGAKNELGSNGKGRSQVAIDQTVIALPALQK